MTCFKLTASFDDIPLGAPVITEDMHCVGLFIGPDLVVSANAFEIMRQWGGRPDIGVIWKLQMTPVRQRRYPKLCQHDRVLVAETVLAACNIHEGDILITVDEAITSFFDTYNESLAGGSDTVSLNVMRNNSSVEVSIPLLPPSRRKLNKHLSINEGLLDIAERPMGFLPPGPKGRHCPFPSLQVSSSTIPMLYTDRYIVEVNGQAVKSIEDVQKMITAGGTKLVFTSRLYTDTKSSDHHHCTDLGPTVFFSTGEFDTSTGLMTVHNESFNMWPRTETHQLSKIRMINERLRSFRPSNVRVKVQCFAPFQGRCPELLDPPTTGFVLKRGVAVVPAITAPMTGYYALFTYNEASALGVVSMVHPYGLSMITFPAEDLPGLIAPRISKPSSEVSYMWANRTDNNGWSLGRIERICDLA